jgi:hypothetical protein
MATYYVATTGSNSNSGTTISQPFATINYAWSQVTSGTDDIIYVLGGVYTYSMLGITTLSNKNGIDVDHRLSVLNYPGETPIIDFTDYLGSSATAIIEVENCDYLHVRGFELKHNLQIESTARLGYGLRVKQQVNYSLFERFNVHHCGGWGIILYAGASMSGYQSTNNTFYRCDSHHHADRYSVDSYGNPDPWEGADGFLINSYNGQNPTYRSTNIYFTECRAWMNSDDGWDNRLCNATIFYDRCWAFWNGFEPGETEEDSDSFVHPSGGGDGYGFKLGSRYNTDLTGVERTVTRCISFENYSTGYQHAHGGDSGTGWVEADSGVIVYNCTAYGNGSLGFNFGTIDINTDVLRNCLSYGTTSDYDYVVAAADDTYNASNSSYWYQRNFSCQAADFQSLDSTGVDGSRGSNGELPELSFLRLASDSDLIDAGIDVGLDYEGDAPDIGAYEYTAAAIVPTITTTSISNIDVNTATSGGNVTDDGGASVTGKGVCWSTSSNPTLSDDYTTDGTGEGSFVSSITGLSPNTTYHVRAYAINSVGTAYGSDVQFTTLDEEEDNYILIENAAYANYSIL